MMKKLFLCLLALCFSIKISAQKSGDIFGTRNFIENKGQFDQLFLTDDKIRYGLDHGDEQVYFADKGVIYVLVKRHKLSQEREEEEKREREEGRWSKKKKVTEEAALGHPSEVYKVFTTWTNANPNIQIIESEKQGHYLTYGDASKNAWCFKKITYKNVYDKIDFEYFIPTDKQYGIKYNIVLHPGADPSKIKIQYSGDVNSLTLNELGNLVATAPYEKVTEHKPVSLQGDKKIETEFSLNGNTVQFNIKGTYDKTKELVIDPWVVTITSMPSPNYGYDVDYDNAGNTYVYGSYSPCKVAKFSPSNTLLWTFPGTVASPFWTATGYVGNFVVHKPTGKTYMGKTFDPALVIRLDAAGNYDNFQSSQSGNWPEIWDMAYHCSTGNIYGFGGGPSTNNSAGIIDQVTGSVTPTGFFLNLGNGGHDVVSHAIDNTGEIYFAYASFFSPTVMDDRLARVNSAFTSSVWLVQSTFNTFNEWNNKNSYVGGPGASTSNGFNCLAVNSNYLYYYDGYNLAAYNKNNGSLVTAATITGYSLLQQGGIAVDDCNNVYIGGNNGNILSYHFTGSAFVALPTINLNVTTTNKFVYDIKYDKPTNLLYFSGSEFVGNIVAANSTTCALAADCNFSLPITNSVVCFGTVVSVTVTNPNNLANPTYSMLPGPVVQSSNVFTFVPNATQTYTMYITGTHSSSIVMTNTALVNVTVYSNPVVSPSVTNGTCSNPITSSVNLNVTFNPAASQNYTCNWNPTPANMTPVNSGTASGLVPGPNSVTVTTDNGCYTVYNFTVPPIPQPASFVVINPSNDYTVTCLNPNVLLTTSVTNGVPLTFTWMPVCTNTLVGASMNFSQACTGQVVGTSSTGCTMTQTYTIYQDFTTPTIAITPTVNNITCAGGSGCFTLTSNLHPNVTTNWFQIVGTNTIYCGAAQGTINIFCAGQPGVYWGESVYNITGCRVTQSVQVTASVGVPQFTVTSPTNFTIGCSTKSVTSMQVTSVITSPVPNVAVNYTFMTPPVTGTPTTFTINPNLNNITIPGTYVVYIKDLTNNCVSSQSISIIQNTIAPNVNFIQPLPLLTCRDFSMVMTGISSNTNTQITWTVPAFPGSSVNPTPNATVVTMPSVTGSSNNVTAIGVWTVGAVDQNNFCSASKTVQINQDIRIPKFTITALTNSVITCKNSDVVIVPVITPSLAAALVPTYVWYPPVGSPVPGTSFNSTAPGTHTALSTSVVNGCTASATYVVATDLTPPSLNVLPAFTLDCNPIPTVVITPSITGSTTGFTYSWTVPPGALTSALTGSALTTNGTGGYGLVVTNTINGCSAQTFYQVIEGNIQASFIADPDYGFAPLNVTFHNTSSTSTGASSIVSTWGYGNGAVTQTVYNTQDVSTTYTSNGRYTVYLKVQKGTCVDTCYRTVIVELPSKFEIPNIFTPNGDKANDIFRLRGTSHLKEIYIIIYDRWGTKVYEVTSDTGNFAWDGTNQAGKNCATGTYFYILQAKGDDGKEYDLRGNVSLFR